MAQHVLTIACRRTLVDETSKLATLVDVIDGFEYGVSDESVPLQGAFPIEVAVVILWTRSKRDVAETATGRLTVIGPDAMKPSHPTEITIDLVKTRNNRSTILFQGFPNFGDGDYTLLTELQVGRKWVEMHRLNLEIKRSSAAAAKAHLLGRGLTGPVTPNPN